jgi:hypothetical protein
MKSRKTGGFGILDKGVMINEASKYHYPRTYNPIFIEQCNFDKLRATCVKLNSCVYTSFLLQGMEASRSMRGWENHISRKIYLNMTGVCVCDRVNLPTM